MQCNAKQSDEPQRDSEAEREARDDIIFNGKIRVIDLCCLSIYFLDRKLEYLAAFDMTPPSNTSSLHPSLPIYASSSWSYYVQGCS